jgi:hypothetical protein
MEAIYLACGAGGPQLKRNPLGANNFAVRSTFRSDRTSLMGPQPPPPSPHYLPQVIVIAGVVALALWLGLGGYTRLTKPNPRWHLPSGDTIEILSYRTHRDVSYDSGRFRSSRYVLLRFRSNLQDSVRDDHDTRALIDYVCHTLDSLGLHRIQVEATAGTLSALFGFSRTRWFQIDSTGDCRQERPL